MLVSRVVVQYFEHKDTRVVCGNFSRAKRNILRRERIVSNRSSLLRSLIVIADYPHIQKKQQPNLYFAVKLWSIPPQLRSEDRPCVRSCGGMDFSFFVENLRKALNWLLLNMSKGNFQKHHRIRKFSHFWVGLLTQQRFFFAKFMSETLQILVTQRWDFFSVWIPLRLVVLPVNITILLQKLDHREKYLMKARESDLVKYFV